MSKPRIAAAATAPATDAAAASDETLVDRARAGDNRAFEAIYRRYAHELYGRLTRLIGPVAEREDLLQQVFLATFRALPTYRGDASMRTYLYRATVNAAYDHLRRRKRAVVRNDVVADLEEVPGAALGSDRSLEQRQELQRALGGLAQLTARQRIALVLHVVEGHSIAEVASLVGARPGAVRERIREARKHLAKLRGRSP